MIEKTQNSTPKVASQDAPTNSTAHQERRAALIKLGRFAAVTVPTVTLLLAAGTKPALAPCLSCVSSRQFKEPEGAVDNDALLSAALIENSAAFDVIDGIGTCLGAIKALNARIDRLEAAL
jgi:hypothetical protein